MGLPAIFPCGTTADETTAARRWPDSGPLDMGLHTLSSPLHSSTSFQRFIPRHKKKTRRLSISGQWCCHTKNVSFWGCDAVARKSVLALTLTMKKYLKNKISRNCPLQEILQWHKKKIKPVWRIRNVLILIPLLVFWSWSGFRSKLLLCFNGKFLGQQTNFNSNKIFFFFF